MAYLIEFLLRLRIVVFHAGERVTALVAHRILDVVELTLQRVDCRFGFAILLLLVLERGAVLRQLFTHADGQFRQHPRVERVPPGVILRIGDAEVSHLLLHGVVLGVFVTDFTQSVHLAGVFFHAAEVLVVPVVILHRFACFGQRVRNIKHTLFENVVKPRGGVRRLDFVQQPAGGGRQPHTRPHGFVEILGVRIYRATGIDGAQLDGGERRRAVAVHLTRVDLMVP